MYLQSSAGFHANELAAKSGDLGDSLAVRTAHESNGGTGTVATFGRTDVKGAAFFYEDVMCSQGYVFGAVMAVCKNYPTCEKSKKTHLVHSCCMFHPKVHKLSFNNNNLVTVTQSVLHLKKLLYKNQTPCDVPTS